MAKQQARRLLNLLLFIIAVAAGYIVYYYCAAWLAPKATVTILKESLNRDPTPFATAYHSCEFDSSARYIAITRSVNHVEDKQIKVYDLEDNGRLCYTYARNRGDELTSAPIHAVIRYVLNGKNECVRIVDQRFDEARAVELPCDLPIPQQHDGMYLHNQATRLVMQQRCPLWPLTLFSVGNKLPLEPAFLFNDSHRSAYISPDLVLITSYDVTNNHKLFTIALAPPYHLSTNVSANGNWLVVPEAFLHPEFSFWMSTQPKTMEKLIAHPQLLLTPS